MGKRNSADATLPAVLRAGLRSIVFAVLATFICSAAVRPAAAATPDFLNSCQAVLSGASSGSATKLDIPVAGLSCWYYMGAVQNMSVLVDQNGSRLLGICAPASTTLLDYVRIFVRYGSRMAERVQENPAAVAVEALSAEFPCGRQGSAAPTKSRSILSAFAPRKLSGHGGVQPIVLGGKVHGHWRRRGGVVAAVTAHRVRSSKLAKT